MHGERHFSQLLDWFQRRQDILEAIGDRQDEVEELLAAVEYELQGLKRHLNSVLSATDAPCSHPAEIIQSQSSALKSRAA